MKKLVLAASVAFLSLVTVFPGAQAAASTSTFNVVINLTGACIVSTAPSDITFNYTAFTGSAVSGSASSFVVKCSAGLPYSLALSNASNATPAASITTTDSVVNLSYTLTVPSTSQTGVAAGNTHSITSSMAANQAGTCSTPPGTGTCSNSAATNKLQTLTVAF